MIEDIELNKLRATEAILAISFLILGSFNLLQGENDEEPIQGTVVEVVSIAQQTTDNDTDFRENSSTYVIED